MRRKLVGLLLALGLSGTLFPLSNSFRGASAAASAAPGAGHNVVLIVTDDQSFESVARMPYVSGRTDWITFDNAFLNVSFCCPSRVSILSGQYSHNTGVEDGNTGGQFRENSTIATWLKSAGYTNSLIGKYLNDYPFDRGNYVPPGWDNWRAFIQPAGYYNYTLNENGQPRSYGIAPADYSTDVLATKATSFINKRTGPFFLMLTPNAPHGPRTPAPRHLTAFTNKLMPRSPSFNEENVADKPAWVRALTMQSGDRMDGLRRDQYRTLLGVDDMVRSVFTSLEEKGILDNTVVMFMTDNGYSFGEHRYDRKTCPYEECMRTPLLVRYPAQAGRHVNKLVQNVDIASTIAEIAGVTPAIRQDGRSIVPFLKQAAPAVAWRKELLLRWGGTGAGGTSVPHFWGIRTDRYKYIELVTGEKELYDLAADPYELKNSADEAAFADIQADLAQRLAVLKQS